MILFIGSCGACVCLANRTSKKAAAVATPPPPPRPPAQATPPSPEPRRPHGSSGDGWITAERPFVKFLAPPGWKHEFSSDRQWGVFTAPTGDAVLAFTTFSRPGESTTRLSSATTVLGVTNVDWRTPRGGTVGKDHFPARVGDGSCSFKGPNGYIWYATVDSGGSEQMLLIFTVKGGAPSSRKNEAQGAIDSLQRR